MFACNSLNRVMDFMAFIEMSEGQNMRRIGETKILKDNQPYFS